MGEPPSEQFFVFMNTLVLFVMGSLCSQLILCGKMHKFSTFATANSFLASSFLLYKRFLCLLAHLIVQVAKTRSAGESIVITLVSKEVIAAGAWVSHSPTSCTQN